MTRAARIVLAALGLLLVGLAILGVFLPGLPTTIFLILASACFVRSSPRLEERLFRLRILRPYVKLVRGEEPMTPRARIASTAIMWTAIVISLAVLRANGGLPHWLAALLIAAGLVGSFAIARFRREPAGQRAGPTDDRDGSAAPAGPGGSRTDGASCAAGSRATPGRPCP